MGEALMGGDKVSSRTSPTVRRFRLAKELKRLREQAGKTREEVAAFVSCAPATISKIESKKTTAPPAYVAMMLEFYGITGEQKDAWMEVAKQARKRGWWQRFSTTIPDWFQIYVGLEEEAGDIRSYQPEGIFGLLQTEGYMRAQILAEPVTPTDEQVEERVKIRLKRQERLTADDAPEIWLILNEAAVRREVGGIETMRDQLLHLVDMARLGKVTLQILPFTAGAHPGSHGAFTIMGFPDGADPDVVYVEYRLGSIYLEQQPEVAAYAAIFQHLVARALGPDQSRAMLVEIAQEMSQRKPNE